MEPVNATGLHPMPPHDMPQEKRLALKRPTHRLLNHVRLLLYQMARASPQHALPHSRPHLDDLVRVLLGQLLDAGAALRAPNHDGPSSGSVQQDGKVHLIGQLQLGGHKQRVDWLACRQQATGCENRAAVATARNVQGPQMLWCPACLHRKAQADQNRVHTASRPT